MKLLLILIYNLLDNDLVVTVLGRLNKRDDAPASFSAQRIVVPQNLHAKIPEILISLPAGFTAEKLAAPRAKAGIPVFPTVLIFFQRFSLL